MDDIISKPGPATTMRVSDSGPNILRLPRVRSFLDDMVAGEDIVVAAKRNGLRVKRGRALMRNPAIRATFMREIEQMRETERARSLYVARTVRDRALEPEASAAQQTASLKAIGVLEGSDRAGTTVHVGVGVQVGGIIGYMVDLSEPAAPPVLGAAGWHAEQEQRARSGLAPLTIDEAAGCVVDGPDRLSAVETIRREAVDVEAAQQRVTAAGPDQPREAERVLQAAADPAGTRRPLWDERDLAQGFSERR